MLKTLKLAIVGLGLVSINTYAMNKVVYGEDNRVDISDATNNLHARLAVSTAAQISINKMKEDGDQVILPSTNLQQAMRVCPSERFSTQMAAARCSGFLVGPDLLVTAGHCMVEASGDCSKYAWVFDYRQDELGDQRVEKKNVYKCKKILKQRLVAEELSDYALIQLERVVEDREPLKFRTEGKVANGTNLVVIGYPSGLPAKIAAGSTVHGNNHVEYFKADLDTFGGNSGSAVFDSKTGLVEGILVRGAKDYIPSSENGKFCFKVNNCANAMGLGCGGESVSRITRIGINDFCKLSSYRGSSYLSASSSDSFRKELGITSIPSFLPNLTIKGIVIGLKGKMTIAPRPNVLKRSLNCSFASSISSLVAFP